MAAGIIGALTAAPEVIKVIGDLVGRFVPDPQAQAQASLELQKLVADREAAAANAVAEVAKAQAATNTAEAQNPSLFVGGSFPEYEAHLFRGTTLLLQGDFTSRAAFLCHHLPLNDAGQVADQDLAQPSHPFARAAAAEVGEVAARIQERLLDHVRGIDPALQVEIDLRPGQQRQVGALGAPGSPSA